MMVIKRLGQTVTVNAVDDATVVTGGISGTGDEDGAAIAGQITAIDADSLTNDSSQDHIQQC